MHLHLLKSFFGWKSCQFHQHLPEYGLQNWPSAMLTIISGKIIPGFNN